MKPADSKNSGARAASLLRAWLTSRRSNGVSLRDVVAVEVLMGRMRAAPDTDARELAAGCFDVADRLIETLREAQSPGTLNSGNGPSTE